MSSSGINLSGAKPFLFPILGVTDPLPFTPPIIVVENRKRLEEVNAEIAVATANAKAAADAFNSGSTNGTIDPKNITIEEIKTIKNTVEKVNDQITTQLAEWTTLQGYYQTYNYSSYTTNTPFQELAYTLIYPVDPSLFTGNIFPSNAKFLEGKAITTATYTSLTKLSNKLQTDISNINLITQYVLEIIQLEKEKIRLELLIAAGISSAENKRLGGGLKGIAPKPANVNSETQGVATNRFLLREAWNTTTYLDALGNTNRRIITPFRAVNNAGDVLSRLNYSCGGACQTPQSRPGLRGLKTAFGSIQSTCDETFVPPSACNVKYVYDSSNYTTYLKQRAVNKNYNDYSNVGNDSNASQVSFRAARHGLF